jgi:hypothetical protein
MQPCAPRLVLQRDAPDNDYLDAPPSTKHPKGLFFGAVQIK